MPVFLMTTVAAVVLGFLLADVLLVVILAPQLGKPTNWASLASLAASAGLIYAGVAIYMFLFHLCVMVINAGLRLGYASRSLVVISIVSSLPFLIIQEKLQTAMLAGSVTPNSFIFYVPTVTAVALLVSVMAAIRYLVRRRASAYPAVSRALGWRGLIATAFVAFLLYAATFNTLNVLAVYPEDQQRDKSKEVIAADGPGADADAPNFLIVVIDAFRHDEFTSQNVPFLWRLAQENIWLTNYHVAASATRPSTTSLFTSLYPAQHGAYNLAFNQEVPGEQPVATTKVSDAIQSLPKLLQDQGYNTVMVTSNKLASDRVFGFERVYTQFNSAKPFEFQIPDPEPLLGYFILRNALKHWKIFKAILFTPAHSRTYFDATRLNPVVEEVLANKDARPYLLYLHYIEPHTPYYADPYRAIQISDLSYQGMLGHYRQELGRIDRSFAELFGSLKANGHLRNTWMLITSDHGEEFYDHGNWGHGKSLYPEVIKVPAILVPPADEPGILKPRQIDHTIENIDVAPTFGEIAGIPAPQYWEGTSVLPLLTGHKSMEANAALSQFNDGRYLWSAAAVSDWQLVYREPPDAIELPPDQRLKQRTAMLFNLASDPLARNDKYGKEPLKAAEMTRFLDAELTRLEASAVIFQGEQDDVNEEQFEQLRALGYID